MRPIKNCLAVLGAAGIILGPAAASMAAAPVPAVTIVADGNMFHHGSPGS